jgi:hypothetical protein
MAVRETKENEMAEEPRTYVTMADKSIGKCSSGHWLPLKGDCDLCGAGPDEKCRYSSQAQEQPPHGGPRP